MKLAYLKAKNIYKIFIALFLFISLSTFVTYYSLAYIGEVFMNKVSVAFNLEPLEATSTGIQIKTSNNYYTKYAMVGESECLEYDEGNHCINSAPDLCQYISLQPNATEDWDVGYTPNQYYSQNKAYGRLNPVIEEPQWYDDVDDWTVSITAPCFEGECPADYSTTTYGLPPAQDLKGKDFVCNISVNEEYDMSRGFGTGVAYAEESSVFRVSAKIGTTPAAGNSNVVFIPGLQASRLYTRGLLLENQLWEPNRNQDIEWLYLDKDGKSLYDVYTRDIIERTNVGMGVLDSNVYKSFADTMDALVSEKKINAWEAMPYDWRMDLNKIVTEPVKLKNGETYNIIDKIIELSESSQTEKVSIVTHSNGGLVAKTLINELKSRGKENLVDQLVMVAAPELGTPDAVTSMLHGDGQDLAGGFLVKKSTARTLGENMMGAYNLLPSEEYFKKVASPVVEFDPSVDKVNNFRTIYGEAIDTGSELKDFFLGKDGRAEPADSDTDAPNILKSSMLALAQANHNAIDTWTPPENIKVTELAGWGVSTVRGVEYFGKEECVANLTICTKTTVLDRRPLYTTEGDKTVVSPSATVGSNTYYLDLKKANYIKIDGFIHKNILEASSTLEFVENLLLNSSSSLPQYITQEKPVTLDKTLEIALHSPVSIDVYDGLGRHTGLINNPNPDSDLQAYEEGIPGSRYLEFGEGKYVLLDEGTAYTVKLQGLDTGTFTLESNTLASNGSTLSSSQFVDIPTSADMKGEIVISATSTASTSVAIIIDVNGDGKNDFTINPAKDFDPIVYLQILKKTVETFNASEKTKNEIYKKIDKIIKSLEKNKTKNAILKIRQFSRELAIKQKHQQEELDRKHKGERDIKKSLKKKKLNSADAEKLLQMLNQLLNNLI